MVTPGARKMELKGIKNAMLNIGKHKTTHIPSSTPKCTRPYPFIITTVASAGKEAEAPAAFSSTTTSEESTWPMARHIASF